MGTLCLYFIINIGYTLLCKPYFLNLIFSLHIQYGNKMAFWLKIFSDARKKQHATPHSSGENPAAHVRLMMLSSCPVCKGRPSSQLAHIAELNVWLASSWKQELQQKGCWKAWGPQLFRVEIASNWKLTTALVQLRILQGNSNFQWFLC